MCLECLALIAGSQARPGRPSSQPDRQTNTQTAGTGRGIGFNLHSGRDPAGNRLHNSLWLAGWLVHLASTEMIAAMIIDEILWLN